MDGISGVHDHLSNECTIRHNWVNRSDRLFQEFARIKVLEFQLTGIPSSHSSAYCLVASIRQHIIYTMQAQEQILLFSAENCMHDLYILPSCSQMVVSLNVKH